MKLQSKLVVKFQIFYLIKITLDTLLRWHEAIR